MSSIMEYIEIKPLILRRNSVDPYLSSRYEEKHRADQYMFCENFEPYYFWNRNFENKRCTCKFKFKY